ncbi:PAS domain-containing protein [Mucilaginibacter gynuensis]
MAETTQPMILLRADAPHFTIVAYNEAYQQATNTHHRNILGWTLWEAFDPERAGGGEGVLLEALLQAMETNDAFTTLPFHYNIPVVQDQIWEECWWQLDVVPVADEGAGPGYLLITTHKLNDRVGE